ncbi:MAG: hypothetical protein ACOY99_09350 [Pseudomonadota bacterium]
MGALYRALGLCAAASSLTLSPVEAAWQCRHARLIDAVRGEAVTGVEDIAIDDAAGLAYLAAYDRRAEKLGAIYPLPVTALEQETLVATPLAASVPIKPHGIALSRDAMGGHALLVVNRATSPAAIDRFRITASGLVREARLAVPELCHANDLALAADGAVLVTNDRAACGGLRQKLEAVLGLATGSLQRWDGAGLRTLRGRIAFANGIAIMGDEIFVAATRDTAVYRLDSEGRLKGRIALPGAPDNLSVGPDGTLYAAAFPSLFGYARFRANPKARDAARSLILAIDPASGVVERLPLDGARLPAGATVAARLGGWLLVGAAYDWGLGLCREGEAS